MNCPNCNYPNPQGVTHCQMCYEVFNKSAADRYLHAQRRARMQRGDPPPPSTPKPPSGQAIPEAPFAAPPRILQESGPTIDWGALFTKTAERLFHLARSHRKELGLAAALILLGILFLRVTSPRTRLQVFGSRLDFAFPSNSSTTYLVTHRTDVKSWSELGGRLDTPLPPLLRDEIGTLVLKASAPKKRAQYVVLHPKEWILTASGSLTQNIPLTHPSLKPARATLKFRGPVLTRDAPSSTRLGHAMLFLLPRWPAATRRPGSQWEEAVEWVERIGDWKIIWKGRLVWELAGLETREGIPCIHLTYRADVRPRFGAVPSWAQGRVGQPTFQGASIGDAYYDPRGRRLLSNDFDQAGALRFSIKNIYLIPSDMRVGRTPRRRWGRPASALPGAIVLQIKNKFGLHKS